MPSYTPPAGNAVSFNFTVPIGGYVPPTGNAIIFNFNNNTGLTLDIDAGVYAITGSAVSLIYARQMNLYTELVTNGGFSVDTSGWMISGTGVTFTASGGLGQLALDPSATGGFASQAISVVPGQQYKLATKLGTGVRSTPMVAVGVRPGGSEFGYVSGAISTMSISLSPAVQSITSRLATITSASVGVTVTGGVPPYSFAWSIDDSTDTVTIGNPSSSSTTFSAFPEMGEFVSMTGRVTVRDSLGAVASTTCSVSFDRELTGAGSSSSGMNTASSSSGTSSSPIIDIVPDISTIYITLLPYGATSNCSVNFDNISFQQTGFYALSGTDPTLVKGRTINLVSGTYTIVGQNITLKATRALTLVAGTYAITGTPVSLLFGHKLTAAPGTYILTPTNVTLTVARAISATSGLYTIVGSNPLLMRRYIMPLSGGVYTQSRTNVSLLFGHRTSVGSKAFQVNGTTITFTYHEVTKLLPDPGVYAIVGSDVSFIYDRWISATPGVYLVQGRGQTLLTTRTMSLGTGSYSYAGTDAALAVGGIVFGANLGVYRLSGSSVLMTVTRQLTFASGTYALTGVDVTVAAARTLSGSGVYELDGVDPNLSAGRSLSTPQGVYIYTGQSAATVRGYNIFNSGGVYTLATLPVAASLARRLNINSKAFLFNWPTAQMTYVRLQGGPRVLGVDFAASRYLAVQPQSRYVYAPSQSRYVYVYPAPPRYTSVAPVDLTYEVPPLDRVA
jgi:hypothetical protein